MLWHAQVATVEATSVGPVAVQLGALSTSLGRFGEAERHLEEALEITERLKITEKLEAPYWTALTKLGVDQDASRKSRRR
jgi:hypothetical protein